jgi:uncharacterized membrane protein YfcA
MTAGLAADPPTFLVSLFALSAAAGALGALLGLGGSVILVPGLVLDPAQPLIPLR